MPDGYKISKIYVGTNQVRPASWVILEADLTTSTLAQLQAKWWTDVASTNNVWYTMDSNWFRPAWSNNNVVAYLYHTFSAGEIANRTSLDLYIEWNWVYSSWSGWPALWIWWTLVSDTALFANTSFSNNSGYRTQAITFNSSNMVSSQVALSTNPYSIHSTYDYSTGIFTFVLKISWTEVYNTSYTFNASQMGTIAWYNYLWFRTWWGIKSGNGNTVTYAKLIINY